MKYRIKLFLAYLYDYTIGLFLRYYYKLSRIYEFAKIGINNYDWDEHYLNELVVFKLKRMLYNFENFGHHSEDCPNYKPKMKSIKLAIKLGERILKDEYYHFMKLHDKKYGELEIDWVPIPNSKHYQMILKKTGEKYERTQQEKDDFIEACLKDDRRKQRDLNIFYRIIGKYNQYWWD